LLNAFDALRDVLGRLGCACCQFADFVGDDGKATALLASPRRLNGGIQRQQIGLFRYAVDDGDNFTNLCGTLAEFLDDAGGVLHVASDTPHVLCGEIYDLLPLGGLVRSYAGCVGGAGCVTRHVEYGLRDLRHRGRRLIGLQGKFADVGAHGPGSGR